ncbi:MAG: cyclodeaminase/cyclohydrolase family protein [Deltaproteobacteria bacterium]|jgi:formiminotetrahydrofolate cyclodeaminase|nr:cyclodeaminase/cyclohydrolase family protein [Deltaproteobacteria bacterium]
MSDNLPTYALSFRELITLASSRKPIPGGGSISAMAAVLGASMGAMVANLTLGKKGYEKYFTKAQDLVLEFEGGIAIFEALTRVDMEAFISLLEALRLPGKDNGAQNNRQKIIQKATLLATKAPLDIACQAFKLLELNLELAAFGNVGAVNDCGVAAILLEAAVRASLLSVDINLPSLEEGTEKSQILSQRKTLAEEAAEILKKTLAKVQERAQTL